MAFDNRTPGRKTPSKAAGGIESLVQAEKLLQIAFILPSSMLVGWLAGAWADSKLHQSWLTIAGVIFGCVSGLVYVIRVAMATEKSASSGEAKDRPGKGTGD
jgi:ATP synthase protein I